MISASASADMLRVACIGDSHTAASFSVPASQTWPASLARLAGHDNLRAFNFGVSGDNTAQILNRLDAVIWKNPDTSIIYAGGNDNNAKGVVFDRPLPRRITIDAAQALRFMPESWVLINDKTYRIRDVQGDQLVLYNVVDAEIGDEFRMDSELNLKTIILRLREHNPLMRIAVLTSHIRNLEGAEIAPLFTPTEHQLKIRAKQRLAADISTVIELFPENANTISDKGFPVGYGHVALDNSHLNAQGRYHFIAKPVYAKFLALGWL